MSTRPTDHAALMSRVKSLADLDGRKFPPLQWAVPGLIPEGFGLFTGAPKVGKSWVTLDLALAVSSGRSVFGAVSTGTPRPVLLLALEDGERRLQGRARRLHGTDEPLPAQCSYATLNDITPEQVPDIIKGFLDEHGQRAPMVILDTLGKVPSPKHQGENDYQRDYRVGSTLKQLVDAHPGSCMLVVHHVRKAESEDWMDSTSGTNGLNGAADWTMNFSRKRSEESGTIRVTGRDVREGEYAMTFDGTRWVLAGDSLTDAARALAERSQTDGLGDRSSEIVRIVGEHPSGIAPKEVAEILGISGKDAGNYLARLQEAGRIKKPSRGIYTSVESVESVEMDGTQDASHFDTFDTFYTPSITDDPTQTATRSDSNTMTGHCP